MSPAAFGRLRIPLLTAAALVALLLWDLTALDLQLAAPLAGKAGFPLRDHWLFTAVLHDAADVLAWSFGLLLSVAVFRPVGALAQVPRARRVQLVAGPLLAGAVVGMMRLAIPAACPWDLAQFGGSAPYASHWSGLLTGAAGAVRCFPGRHAATGFAFIAGYFALRERLPAAARAWLASALVLGLVLGLSQQVRGAHFMSDTLWSAWACWLVAWASDPLFARFDPLRQGGAAARPAARSLLPGGPACSE